MSRRTCASCSFYERAPIARMGWCRHPDLFAEHQNHLVSAVDLDCDRGLGAFWEPQSEEQATKSSETMQLTNGREIISVTRGGSPVYPVSGASGYSGDPPPPAPGGGGDGPNWGNGDGDYNYYEEERYFTDYIRIAAPILGVIVLVVLLWFWIASFLGDDGNDDPNSAADGTTTITLPTLAATANSSPDAALTPSPPGIAPTATTPGTGTTPISPSSQAPTEDPGGGPVDIYLGATVEVANTDGAGVNVRDGASTSAGVITVFLDGTQALAIDGPVEAEGFTWWQISGNEVAAGWVVSDFLVVVE